MSTLTTAGKRLQADALGKALCGGSYVVYDGDGAELGRAEFPQEWAAEHSARGVGIRFENLSGRVFRMGRAVSFAAFARDLTDPVLAGIIGQSAGDGISVVLDDPQLYEGMELLIEVFQHVTNFVEKE